MIKTLLLPMVKKFRKLLISIMIVSALGCTIMTGLSSSHESLKYTLYDYVDKYDYPDGTIKTETTSRDVINNIDKKIRIVPRYSMDTLVISKNRYLSSRVISYGDNDFYKFYVWESIPKEGVYLEYNFAKDNNISIGDKLKFKIGEDNYKEFIVSKIVSTPETLSIESSSNFSGFASDFGYVYVNNKIIEKELDKEYKNQKVEVDKKDKEIEDQKQEAENKFNELERELDYYDDLINSESYKLNSLKETLDNASTSLDELLIQRKTISNNRELLVNQQEKLTEAITTIKTINNSLNELNNNKQQLDELKDLIDYLSTLPEDTEIDTFINDIIIIEELSNIFKENNISIDLEGSVWQVSNRIKELCNEIISDYEYMNLDSTKDYINNLQGPEETEAYYKLINTVKKYYPLLNEDNLREGIDTTYNRLNILKEIIDNCNILNTTITISELEEKDFREIANLIYTYKDIFKEYKTIGDLINGYNSLQDEIDNTINTLISTKNDILNELAKYGIKEEDLDKYTNIDDVLKELDNALCTIDNYINQLDSGLNQYRNTYNEGLSKLNTSKYELNINKNKLQEEYQSALSKYNAAKDEIKEAYNKLKDKLNLNNYSNEFLLKYKSKNKTKTLKEVEKELGVDVKNSYTYETSNIKKRIDVNLGPIETLSTFIPLVFFIIIMIVIFLFMSLLIKQCRREIGILRALGYSKFKVRLLFCSIMFIVSLLSIILGTIISIGIIAYICIYYQAFFPLPYFTYVLDYKMYLASIIITTIVSQIATLISTISIDSIKPAEAMSRELPEESNTSFIVSKMKLSPFNKFSIISMLRNKMKFIFSVICISACVMMIFTAFSFIKSKNYILEELYDKRINYDAQVFFSKEIDDELLKDIKNLDYTSDVQKLDYYNLEIKGANKSRKTVINEIDIDTKLINIYDINSKNKIELDSDGIILEKHIAQYLNVKKDDYITVNNNKIKISNISNQCINRINYISNNTSNDIGNTDIYSVILNINKNKYEDLIKYLSNKDGYLYTVYTSRSYADIVKTFNTYDLAAWIIIGFAIIIGFVIVWNTSLTNLLEQRKKLCLIKALGYQNSEISRNWFIQSIIQFIVSLVIGFPIGIYIARVALKKISTIDREYIFVNDIKMYILTAIIVLIYITISHIIVMNIFKKWNISEEIKDRE